MDKGIVQCNVDRSHRMLVHQGLREFGDLLSALVAHYQDEIFSALIGDGPNAVVLPSDMVDNSFSPCERLSGWFSFHSACLIGCFILSLSIPICSQHH